MSEYMTNAQGHLVPVSSVKPEDKLENDLVMELYQDAHDLQQGMRAFKECCMVNIDTFLDLIAEKYGAKRGGGKGNMTFTSFDGMTKIQISISEFIAFGPQLKVAKDLIDQCIRQWSGDANENIKALIFDAFRVDKNNRINTARIMGLKRLPIRDETWKKAMEAIDVSMRVHSSKQYIRFYRRASVEAPWEACSLDIASL